MSQKLTVFSIKHCYKQSFTSFEPCIPKKPVLEYEGVQNQPVTRGAYLFSIHGGLLSMMPVSFVFMYVRPLHKSISSYHYGNTGNSLVIACTPMIDRSL